MTDFPFTPPPTSSTPPPPPTPPSTPPPPPPQGPKNTDELKKKLLFYLKKPKVVVALVGLFLGLLVLISINDIMKALLHSRPEVIVPNIEGQSLLDSLAVVSGMNLSLIQDGQEFDESLPAGTVIRQHPPSGMKVRSGRPVRIIVSKGGQVVFVPLITGSPVAEAQSRLAVDGLQIGSINEIYSESDDSGVVISQLPSSGTVVTRGALIDLDVSKGAPPVGAVIVPNFIGRRVEAVEDWAAENQVKVGMKENPKAVGPAGTVVKQRPEENQPLTDGIIYLTIVPLLASEQGFRFSYKLPAEVPADSSIDIKARSNRGEFGVYSAIHTGGDRIEVPMDIQSTTRVRVYVNGDLEHERVIEP